MRTSRETDFRKLKITSVTMTYHSQHPQRPSLSPHVLLDIDNDNANDNFERQLYIISNGNSTE